MPIAQAGIFAFGNPSHAYLEFDLLDGRTAADLIAAIRAFDEPWTTGAGVNVVVGLRPELWKQIAPSDTPAGVEGFHRDLVGIEGFTMPAKQHDLVIWLAGGEYDAIFDLTRAAIAALNDVARIADETASWPYRGNHDLTGFIDGTENPQLAEAAEVALVPDGQPGAGGQRSPATEVAARRGQVGGAAGEETGVGHRQDEG